jgi:N-acetylglucosamine-6-sulfatase
VSLRLRLPPAHHLTHTVSLSFSLAFIFYPRRSGAPRYARPALPTPPARSVSLRFNSSGGFNTRTWYPPVPAARHWAALSGAALPRPPSFNDSLTGGKPAWLRALPGLSAANVTFLEEIFRLRLRALMAVDEVVQALGEC